MTEIDIDAIRQNWQAECGPCDYGLPMGCMCPDGDPRVPISALLRKVDELTAELAKVREQAAADVERMPITLGDAGWEHLEARAVEADYPAGLVRRRRTRDDFTTATIEAAYQYGYRQAAKVARGEVSPR